MHPYWKHMAKWTGGGALIGGGLGALPSTDYVIADDGRLVEKKVTGKDRLHNALVGAASGGISGAALGHTTALFRAGSGNWPPTPTPPKKKPALDIAKKRWGGKPSVLKGEKVAMMMAFCDEMAKIAEAQKEAGLLNNAGLWMSRNAAPMMQRAGRAISNETQALGHHVVDAMAKGQNSLVNPAMPVHGLSELAGGVGSYLASKVPQGPKGLLRKGVGFVAGNGLEALTSPSRLVG